MNKGFLLVASLLCCTAFSVVIGAAGIRINLSESMPRGIWQHQPLTGPAERGDIVLVCLQNSEFLKRYIGPGNCKTGMEPIIKPVVAVAGDDLMLSVDGITVNGHKIPNTAPLTLDHTGTPLVPFGFGPYHVPSGQVFLISDWASNSFDSRYIGPISVDTIIARAIPILVESKYYHDDHRN